MFRDNQSHSRVPELVGDPKEIEPLGTAVQTSTHHRSDFRGSRYQPAPRESL